MLRILNPNVKVILKTECGGRTALLLFSPQPGNYQVIAPESFPLKKNDEVRFFCPICSRDLTSKRDKSMAEITFSTPGGQSGLCLGSEGASTASDSGGYVDSRAAGERRPL